jgi:hypothetical protein
MLNVAVPPNSIALEIESDSVPDVAAIVVTVAPLRSERGGVVADLARVKFDVELPTVLANRIESTFTASGGAKLLVPVILIRLPSYTSDHVPDVVGVVVQLLAVDQLLLVPLPNQVVSVPADAVLAAAMQARVSSVLWRAEGVM